MRQFAILVCLLPSLALAQVTTDLPNGAAVGTTSGHVCDPADWYPIAALKNKEMGVTNLCFRIEPDGGVRDIQVLQSSGYPDLDQASMSCVSTWRYKPAMNNGQPVEVPWVASVRWCLRDNAEAPASCLTSPNGVNLQAACGKVLNLNALVTAANNPPSAVIGDEALDRAQQCVNGHGDEAIAACTWLLQSRRTQNTGSVYVNRGSAYGKIGRYSDAIEDFNKANEIQPNDPSCLSQPRWGVRRNGAR